MISRAAEGAHRLQFQSAPIFKVGTPRCGVRGIFPSDRKSQTDGAARRPYLTALLDVINFDDGHAGRAGLAADDGGVGAIGKRESNR